MPDWVKDFWWDLTYVSSHAAFLLGWSARIEGRQNIPTTGPVLVIANHQSFFDPLLIGMSSPRSLSYLARKTLFDNRAFGFVIDVLNAVPVDQEGVGKEGIKTILSQLHEGRAVVVFPEGERTPDGQLKPLRPGISLLIKRVQAPIVPVGIAGAYDAWPRRQRLPRPAPLFLPPCKRTIAICVGRPLDGSHFAAMPREQIINELYGELNKVHQRAERLRRK